MEILEDEKDKIKVACDAELAFLNLVNEKLWEQKGIKFASYTRKHPYVGHAELVVKSSNPKGSVLSALKDIESDCKELEKLFKHSLE